MDMMTAARLRLRTDKAAWEMVSSVFVREGELCHY